MSSVKLNYEVVVVGGGPAGISAACAAAESGVSVGLFEMTPWLGGQIWRNKKHCHMPWMAKRWLNRLNRTSARIHTQSTIFAAPRGNLLLAENPDGVQEIRYCKLIIAVGARELFIPFPGWTLPGVFGVGGLHNLAKLGWEVKGKRVVLAGSGPLLFAAGAHLRKLGAKVVLIAEQADLTGLIKFGAKLPFLSPDKIFQGAHYQAMLLGVPYRTHCWPVKANGNEKLESVTLTKGNKSWTIECDYLATAFGLCTNLELPDLFGCDIEDERVVTDLLGQTSVEDVYCVGEPTGISGVDGAISEGLVAGYTCGGAGTLADLYRARRKKTKKFGQVLAESFALRDELKKLATDETIICRCEDAKFGMIKSNSQWREAKLYSHVGMGPCQGRTCSGVVRYLFGWKKTSIRPPIFPVRVGSLVEMADNGCQRQLQE